MPKEQKKVKIGHSSRHAPLGQVIQDDDNRGKYATSKRGVISATSNKHNDDEHDEELLDERSSKKILELGRLQQQEMMQEEEAAAARNILSSEKFGGSNSGSGKKQTQTKKRRDDDDSSDEESDDEDFDEEELLVEEDDKGYVTMSDTIGLTPDEEALLSNMMGGDDDDMPERRNLADIIMSKIEEKEAGVMHQDGEEEEEMMGMELPPKVVQVYTDIGKLLTHYTSGKLPKAFKVIPSLHNWEEVLYLTRPDLWTPQAMYAATRIFASNLNPKMAQRFYNLVLLDSVRADIHGNHKLNYHYYMALKKSVYKPAAFFKGILLPLCKEGCTLREAVIVASVLQRVSIPVHHSAVAIHKLAQMNEYNGAASIFIKTLLNKKYSLPAPVITSLINHFVRFTEDEQAELPVLWHQALLTFVERYKGEVSVEAKEKLRELMKVHFHPKITVEIRRELFGSAAWREERGDAMTM
mmetsp:Transcript_8895/g.15109  ORF Transcript_8895/g.15109 Transcript_8895/m.15109 type:complete len:468 (+) Transcript_8895:2182-3585(+)